MIMMMMMMTMTTTTTTTTKTMTMAVGPCVGVSPTSPHLCLHLTAPTDPTSLEEEGQ